LQFHCSAQEYESDHYEENANRIRGPFGYGFFEATFELVGVVFWQIAGVDEDFIRIDLSMTFAPLSGSFIHIHIGEQYISPP
jgi:hypothetical protein